MSLEQQSADPAQDRTENPFLARPIPFLVGLWRQFGSETTPRRTPSDEPEIFAALKSEIIPRLVIANRFDADIARSEPVHTADSPAAFSPDDRRRLLDALLSEDPGRVWQIVEAHLENGRNAGDLLVSLLPWGARELGAMWEDDRASFVDVTIGVCRLHDAVHRLSERSGPEPDATTGNGPSILMASAPGEQHIFGVLIASELFRKEGWLVALDTSGDAAALAQQLATRHFDMVGVSVSHESVVEDLPGFIRSLRKASRNKSLRIIVGGALIEQSPHKAREAGADAVARGGADAPKYARKLLATP